MKQTTRIDGLRLIRHLPGLLSDAPNALIKLTASHKGILRIGIGKDYFLFLTHPEQYKYVLKTNYANFPRGKTLTDLKPILGNGLLISEDEDWKKQRQYLAPAFHTKFFEGFYPVVLEEIEWFTSLLNKSAESGRRLNYSFELKKLAARISFRTLFINDPALLKDDVLHALDSIYENASFYKHSMRQGFKLLFMREDAFGYGSAVKPAFALIDKIAWDIFKKCESGESVPMEFLRVLLEETNAGRVAREEAVDQMKNAIFAGYDTVGETLTWLWLCLSKETKAANSLKEELISRFHGAPPPYEELPSLNMLMMFIKETMRLYPVAWAYHRIVKEDDVVDGYPVKKKEWIMMSPYVLHRNPEFWSDPLKFNPERFEGDNNPVPVRYDYLPFGQGPRVCIGNRLGMFELQLIASTIIQKYSFRYEREHPGILADILIRQKHKLYMDVLKD